MLSDRDKPRVSSPADSARPDTLGKTLITAAEHSERLFANPTGRYIHPFIRSAEIYMFVLPALVFMIGLMIYPILFNIDISFRQLTSSNLMSGKAAWVGWENYRVVIADQRFQQALENSIIFTVVSVVFQIGIGLGLALFYNRPFPGNTSMRSLYLIAYAVPIIVVGSVFRWLLEGQFGVINWVLTEIGVMRSPIYWLNEVNTALWSVIFINIWLGIPFNMIVLLAGLKGIPSELYEAAEIDGAGRLQRFWHLTLPLLRPAVMAVSVLGMIFTLKSFDVIWIATRGGPANASEVLPTFAFKLIFDQFLFGRGAAVLNLLFLILFALSLLYLIILRREAEPS
jgi:multiple sugar transport system permease protein